MFFILGFLYQSLTFSFTVRYCVKHDIFSDRGGIGGTILGCQKIVRNFFLSENFRQKCKIWAETPHFGKIQGQHYKFDHP